MRQKLLILFFAILTSNIILVDVWIFTQSRTREKSKMSQCDFSRLLTPEREIDEKICPQSCVNLVKEATSSAQATSGAISAPKVYVTTIVQPAPIENPLKEYIINFGASVWTASDWQSVPDLIKTVNLSNYNNVENIYFEVVAHLSNENTKGFVRLYNNSDKKIVSGSEVNFNSMKCQPATSVPINLESYNKEYQIQVKSTEGATFYIDSARLRIVSQ
jgi:hypothetical protein